MDTRSFSDAALTTLDGLAQPAFDAAINGFVTNPAIPFNHNRLCAIRCLRYPTAQHALAFPTIAGKIQTYLQVQANRTIIKNVLRLWYPHMHTLMALPPSVVYTAADWNGIPGITPDAATDAILEGCDDCLHFLIRHRIIRHKSILCNENGNSLLYVAIRAGHVRIVTLLAGELQTRHDLLGLPSYYRPAPIPNGPPFILVVMDYGPTNILQVVWWESQNPRKLAGGPTGSLLPLLTPRRCYNLCEFANKAIAVDIYWMGRAICNGYRGVGDHNIIGVGIPNEHAWHRAMRNPWGPPFWDWMRWAQEQPLAAAPGQEYHSPCPTTRVLPLHVAVREDRVTAVAWLCDRFVASMTITTPWVDADPDFADLNGRTAFQDCLDRWTKESVKIFQLLLRYQATFRKPSGAVGGIPSHANTAALFQRMMAAFRVKAAALQAQHVARAISTAQYRMSIAAARDIIGYKWQVVSVRLPQSWFTSDEYGQICRGLSANRETWMSASLQSRSLTRTRSHIFLE